MGPLLPIIDLPNLGMPQVRAACGSEGAPLSPTPPSRHGAGTQYRALGPMRVPTPGDGRA